MIRLLDGGMGQEIFRRTGRPDGGWQALAAVTHFEIVRDLHGEYLDAGADIITTNTYSLSRYRMNVAGLSDRFGEANRAACAAAEAAREAHAPGALIAGAIGPARGSYQPDRIPPSDRLEQEVLEQALIIAPHVDFFIIETMTTSDEAFASVRASASTGKPVWVALTLHETGPPVLRGGEPIAVALDALAEAPADAVLLNCTAPEQIDVGIDELVSSAAGRPAGAYANAFVPIPSDFGHGTGVNHLGTRTDVTPEIYAQHAARWLDAGATIVGGCCEVLPPHIAALRRLIDARS